MIASEGYLMRGERKPLENFLKVVDEITLKDTTTITQRIISSPHTMTKNGDLCTCPEFALPQSLSLLT